MRLHSFIYSMIFFFSTNNFSHINSVLGIENRQVSKTDIVLPSWTSKKYKTVLKHSED